jgi:hypothetical protein
MLNEVIQQQRSRFHENGAALTAPQFNIHHSTFNILVAL